MKTHTPGPWTHGKQCANIGNNHFYVVGPPSRPAVANVWISPGHLDEADADARLIAVAPDLLEACKMFVDACENAPSKTAAAVRMARAAIAKAEGN